MRTKILLLGVFVCVTQYSFSQCNGVTLGKNELINDTQTTPFSYISQIFPTRGNTYEGTAFFIHPKVMLTAGHNVRKRKGFFFTPVKRIVFKIGATNTKTELIKDSINTIQYENIISGNDEKEYDIQDDWGVIIMDNTNSNKVAGGVFAFEVFDPKKNYGTIYKSGYPSIKPKSVQRFCSTKNYMYDSTCNCLKYDFETEHGDSGAPIWYINNGVPTVIAIHTAGDIKKRYCSTGTIITQNIYDKLISFCQSKGINVTK